MGEKLYIAILINNYTSEVVRKRCYDSVLVLSQFTDVEFIIVGGDAHLKEIFENYADEIWGLKRRSSKMIDSVGSIVDFLKLGDVVYVIEDDCVSFCLDRFKNGEPSSWLGTMRYARIEECPDDIYYHDLTGRVLDGEPLGSLLYRRHYCWGHFSLTYQDFCDLRLLSWPTGKKANDITLAFAVAVSRLGPVKAPLPILCDQLIVSGGSEGQLFDGVIATRERYARQHISAFEKIDSLNYIFRGSNLRDFDSRKAVAVRAFTLEQVLVKLASRVARVHILQSLWDRTKAGSRIYQARSWLRRRRAQTRIKSASEKIALDKSVPIVLNNRNRLTTTRNMVTFLKKSGYKNILILDNDSTYPPLIDWYQELEKSGNPRVEYLGRNRGPLALLFSREYNDIIKQAFVYSDSDIVPGPSTSENFIERLAEVLEKNPHLAKVGAALAIDDLPDTELADRVKLHEQQFWLRRLEKDVYDAPVDTTFALYRPRNFGGWWLPACRVAGSCTVLHAPWYTSAESESLEDKYYRECADENSSWS